MPASNPASVEAVAARCAARHDGNPARLLEVLREAQDELRGLSPEAIDALARALRRPRVEVEAVAGFYHLLRTGPRAEYELLFSDNIVDRMLGKNELMAYVCQRLWIEAGKISEDGRVYVGETSDIGLGDQGPAALINGLPLPSLDLNRLDVVAVLVRDRKPLPAWPPKMFEVALNVRRADALLGEPLAPGAALARALELGPRGVIGELERSGLRGRGGAGYPTARKWASCRGAPGERRFVVCNADEGEPGTFKDRVLLQGFPDLVFDGMTLAALATGAARGIVYLRGEYLYLRAPLEAALARRRADGRLGRSILGRDGFDFDIEIVLGAGAYVCGEESALLESLEGRPGRPRNRPPYPDTHGYLGEPTVVNNVETFACAAIVAARGGEAFAAIGTPSSTGTKLISVSGDCERPGVYEVPFGTSVRQVLADCGARDVLAVQVGGPSGTCLSWQEFDRRLAFEDVPTAGAFMVFNRRQDMFEVARNFARFFAHESCGFCTPCRVGTALLTGHMDKLAAGKGSAYDIGQMKRLMHIMLTMSHCGLGHTAARPVVETMEKFPQAYERRLARLDFAPAFDLDAALATARRITGRDDPWAHIAEEAR